MLGKLALSTCSNMISELLIKEQEIHVKLSHECGMVEYMQRMLFFFERERERGIKMILA